jgi:hypothetical protein
MNTHLSPDEVVDALDATLAPARLDHARTCASCAREVAELAGLMRDIDGTVPEPSPLFWDHLSQRIRHATLDEPVPAQHWWRSGWRPVAAAGAMALVMALAIAIRTAPIHDTSATPAAVADVASPFATDDAAWDAMEEMASRLSSDDVRLLVATAPGLTPAVGDLSASEREAFVRLLGSELNGEVR